MSNIAAPTWCPYITYTWTKSQIKAWINEYGSWCFYDGKMWSIKTRRIFGDQYEVSFKEKKV